MLNQFRILLTGALFVSCSASQPSVSPELPSFLLEGHRGARGLMPENTIPAMKRAIAEGANVIEVDVYLTADEQVLVVHDPFANAQYTSEANGTPVTPENAKTYTWHKMKYADIRKLDVGSRRNPGFPQQQTIPAYMPLLGELIDSVEAFTMKENISPVWYNIELKTSRYYDSMGYNAVPAKLVDAVMKEVERRKLLGRFYIQSFDERPIQYARKKYPDVKLGFLAGNSDWAKSRDLLGFNPDVFSPSFHLVDENMIREVHAAGPKLVPWTVNTTEDMKKLMGWGVDGIITDYPDSLRALRR